MIICGQEFEFSALNANDLDRMDAAQQHMQAASDRESKRAHTGTADILRGQCRLMMGYFDELLGEGASERLGLDGNNFGACRKACPAHEPGAAPRTGQKGQAQSACKLSRTACLPDGGAGGCAGIRKAENRAADRCPAGYECPAG